MLTNIIFETINGILQKNRDRFITKREILEECFDLKKNGSVKGCKYFGSMEATLRKMKEILGRKGLSFVYKNGRDCAQGFMYPPNVADPMAEELLSTKKMRMKQVMRLLQNSQGLFPMMWLADLVGKNVFMNSPQTPIIFFGENLQLRGLEFLPVIYDAIESRKVLELNYTPGFREQAISLIVHPYRLKEYNQRWFLFCRSTDKDGKIQPYSICALDRIRGEIVEASDISYLTPEKTEYDESYFKDIVGVTRPKKSKPQHIIIQCKDEKTAARIDSKPIHKSQKWSNDEEKTSFSLDIIPNNEFYSQILSYGTDIVVLSPVSVKEEMRRRVQKMNENYS